MTGSSAMQAADSLKIIQISRHWVDSANKSVKKTVTEQQFFTKDDTLFRKIFYSEKTGQITGYMRCYYKNGRLFTKETFSSKDTLEFIMKHEYSPAGDLIVLTKLVPEQGNLFEKEKTLKTYDPDHKLIAEKKTFEKKTGTITSFTYNTAGLLVTESKKYKKAAKSPFKLESKTYSYSPDNLVSQVNYAAKDNSGRLIQYTEDYSYNAEGELSGIRYSGKDKPPIAEKVYKYYYNGKLRVIEDHDAAGKIIYLLHYEYKEHFMNRGTEDSYYENF
ncbi:MAG: hypothetical protein JXA72_00185 [Bacteroidales bacterium]|nr:hypothetical protein [Bacteroidales bacterium]